MYQGVSGVSNGIECIKEYHGASSVSRSKCYQEVSNVYWVYQRVSSVLRDIKCIRYVSSVLGASNVYQ